MCNVHGNLRTSGRPSTAGLGADSAARGPGAVGGVAGGRHQRGIDRGIFDGRAAGGVLQGLDMGDELLHLRMCLDGLQTPLQTQQQEYLRTLRHLLESAPTPDRAEDLTQPTAQFLAVLAAVPGTDALELAQGALLLLQQSWRRWCLLRERAYGLREWSFGGVLLSPFLVYAVLALLATGAVRAVLHRSGLSRWIWHEAFSIVRCTSAY
jgi:hypothetical protein